MSKFAILASARTGSTSLARVLGESPEVKMAIEPFHPGFADWNPEEKKYSELITDADSMNSSLDELFSKYTAIKVLDYQFAPDLYFIMLRRKDLKIIYLTRKNLAAMALSSLVALQTGEYQKTDKDTLYDHLKPVDLQAMAEQIDYAGKINKKFAKFLDLNRPNDHLKLFYEDLYSEDLNKNIQTLSLICEFLKISIPAKEAIIKYMMPSNAKINYGDIYKKVPNYEEIVKKFGEIN